MGKVTITNVSEIRLGEASCPDCSDPDVRDVRRLQRNIVREAVKWDESGLGAPLRRVVADYLSHLLKNDPNR